MSRKVSKFVLPWRKLNSAESGICRKDKRYSTKILAHPVEKRTSPINRTCNYSRGVDSSWSNSRGRHCSSQMIFNFERSVSDVVLLQITEITLEKLLTVVDRSKSVSKY